MVIIYYSVLTYVVFLKCEYLNDPYFILAKNGRWDQRFIMVIYGLQQNVCRGKMKITFPWKWSVCALFSFNLNEEKSHEKCSIFQATKFFKDFHSFSFSVLFRYLCKRTNIITRCRNAPRSISPVFANISSSDYAVCTASLMFAF